MRTIWHIENKAVSEHEYFGSLTALFRKFGSIGVSKSKIEKDSAGLPHYKLETETHIVRKGQVLSVSDIVFNRG